MSHHLGEHVYRQLMTRRDFLWLASLSTAGAIAGCAINPVTGKRQVMLMSESQEIEIDRQNSPHQFSADYGPSQDQALNEYITEVGNSMTALSHRPNVPYSFRCVNATYVNAYAFPGGSIAATRGILLAVENEAELAGLLGHEIGHVNARHTAARMTKSSLVGAAVAGVTAYVGSKSEEYGSLAAGLGGIGAGMLLARYSRDDERQADALGMEYMTRAGQSPNGMVGLMDLLRSISSHKPNAIEMMFATHPMSEERYQSARKSVETTYQSAQNAPLNRERYMDHTARLRRMKGGIEDIQNGESEMAREQFPQAETYFDAALQKAPEDYAALVVMAKCQFAQKKYDRAQEYAQHAKQVYPEEAQAHHISGLAQLMQQKYEAAYADFSDYESMLPGNPNTTFFKGLSQEGMEHVEEAAGEYQHYLQMVSQGEQAQHAYQHLVEWGYIKEQEE